MSTYSISIQIVDDHALLRDMLKQRLNQESGIEVVADAANGSEAIEAARRIQPDILLMDIDMPGISAFEATRLIRAASPRTRVIFLSAYVNDSYINQALGVEAAGYVIKEHSLGKLLDAIRAAISIPVLFIPHRYKGRLLIDGGFVNPLPIDICRTLGAERIIAVNVLRKIDYTQQELSEVLPTNASMNIKRVFLEYFDCATARLIDYQLTYLEKGVLLNINTDGIRMSDFEKGMEAIQRGYTEACAYRDRLKKFAR